MLVYLIIAAGATIYASTFKMYPLFSLPLFLITILSLSEFFAVELKATRYVKLKPYLGIVNNWNGLIGFSFVSFFYLYILKWIMPANLILLFFIPMFPLLMFSMILGHFYGLSVGQQIKIIKQMLRKEPIALLVCMPLVVLIYLPLLPWFPAISTLISIKAIIIFICYIVGYYVAAIFSLRFFIRQADDIMPLLKKTPQEGSCATKLKPISVASSFLHTFFYSINLVLFVLSPFSAIFLFLSVAVVQNSMLYSQVSILCWIIWWVGTFIVLLTDKRKSVWKCGLLLSFFVVSLCLLLIP